MTTTPYVDPQTIHNPAPASSPPASWGDALRDNLEFLIEPPSCRVKKTTVSQSIPHATNTAMEFNDADEWDTDDFHDPSTNNTRLTVPTGLAGKYLVAANCCFSPNATGVRTLGVRINGSTRVAQVQTPVSSGTYHTELSISTIVELNVGDYVEFTVYQGSGSSLTISGTPTYSTWGLIHWVSR